MERLTVKWKPKLYDVLDPIDIVDNEYSKANFEKLLVKLGEYEDAEEQGLLLKLPCKVGDTVYYPENDINFIFPVRISKIIVMDLELMQFDGCFFDCNGDPAIEYEFDNDDFGKTVFLTKEEAEQALVGKKEV